MKKLCFHEKVLVLLEPMGEVQAIKAQQDKNEYNLLKDNVEFGKIKDQSVFLKQNKTQFKKVNEKILKSPDCFLREATKAYWIAEGLY